MIIAVIAISLLILGIILWGIYRHQRLLQDRAQLMRDALRHRDFSFRLPGRGLLFGERALQNAVNDMGHEIEKLVAHNEVESWQRLTRVLTHEIMNVITPIRSISQACLGDEDIKGTSYEEGMKAIYDASAGMAVFVENYRKMTQLQEPVLKPVNLREFLGSIASLYSEMEWEIAVEEDVFLNADESMLRQVFINIVKNAKEADARKIGISYRGRSVSGVASGQDATMKSSGNRAKGFSGILSVSNDGHCIPDDVAREIFIPFFTTKHRGSGIGLSLSRQILLKQGLLLSLSDHPLPGYNVTFLLEPDRP